ncbi:hypothetical protein [Thermoflavifilum thermophilum]|uniref:Glycosyl hydrolase family 67 N-terminus n=1 Tax=Thermoflavifilum thermophilum TaxID=1393122 RepID=A0A1I7NIY2_9BACT|nr:hypothetical protein [Thermoflavifilum thermophilum]SFV34614.1 hypothetical protein SAMN05660895_2047 [Thermoflavifilum thermophilum]
MKKWILTYSFLLAGIMGYTQQYTYIVLKKHAHPAVKSAAYLLAKALHIDTNNIVEESEISIPSPHQIVLDEGIPSSTEKIFLQKDPQTVQYDGYIIRFHNKGALIFGKRPRSLLYAAGDVCWWKNIKEGVYVRQPAFKIRDINLGNERNIPLLIAQTGANIIFENIHPDFVTLQKSFPQIWNRIPPEDQQKLLEKKNAAIQNVTRILQACHDADVDFYPFLYGNDIVRWSPVLAKAIYDVYPFIKGVRAPHSWEKASINPSLPLAWEIMDSILSEYVQTLKGDGLITTFWDEYGIYSQDSLSVGNGLNQFNKELYKNIGEYERVLKIYHLPLIVRTWSSGTAHWVSLRNNEGTLERQFVHAPGYGGFSGDRLSLWKYVIDSLPADIVLQTKAYMSDCFPAARDNTLIGKVAPHPQIIEYQMTGQTTGLYYLPAINVSYTDSTLKRAYAKIGSEGGTSLFYGATHQVDYHPFSDIINSINLFAWKELSWNIHASIQKIWNTWALQFYAPEAVPYIVKALQLSEPVINDIFSTLGFGWDTNSGFPGTIDRREVLLMYTNRYYLPEYQRFLIPNKENIEKVIHQKDLALKRIDSMFIYLNQAKTFLTNQQYEELDTRFNWLKYVALVNKELEVSYWRYRYLRYLFSLRTTDTTQFQCIVDSYKRVAQLKDSLFQFNPDLIFSPYHHTLGEINRMRHISLGSPLPLMRDIYTESQKYVEEFTGPISKNEAYETK